MQNLHFFSVMIFENLTVAKFSKGFQLAQAWLHFACEIKNEQSIYGRGKVIRITFPRRSQWYNNKSIQKDAYLQMDYYCLAKKIQTQVPWNVSPWFEIVISGKITFLGYRFTNSKYIKWNISLKNSTCTVCISFQIKSRRHPRHLDLWNWM
jgi:hypothetical protein